MRDQRSTNMPMNRRTFLKAMLATAAVSGCGDPELVIEYDPTTAPLKMPGYYGLAELPFFELRKGRLVNVVPNFPKAIDFHGHLGFVVGDLARTPADLTVRNTMKYLIDCDGHEDCHMDMEVYLNQIASQEMLDDSESALLTGAMTGKGPIVHHTVPNYVAELDEMKFDTSLLLPIKLNLVQPDDMEDNWRNAVTACKADKRFHFFGSVHPAQEGWREALQQYKADGVKGIKFHPTMQRLAPDSDEGMAIIEECDRLGLHVFFHAGKAGIEPGTGHFANMENYDLPLNEFPNTTFIFGHSGARDWEEALVRGQNHSNIVMEFAGPSIQTMKAMLEAVGPDRLVFGSDWPFYPLAATLAKVLHITWEDEITRDKILEHNARRLLDL